MASLAHDSTLTCPGAFEDAMRSYLEELDYTRSGERPSQELYDFIRYVLLHPGSTRYGNAQDRHWANKEFSLDPLDDRIVLHPWKAKRVKGVIPRIILRKDIYAALRTAHLESNHGGRDKTFHLIKQRFTHLPKELVARFVELCPTCAAKRDSNAAKSPKRPAAAKSRSPPTSSAADTSSLLSPPTPLSPADTLLTDADFEPRLPLDTPADWPLTLPALPSLLATPSHTPTEASVLPTPPPSCYSADVTSSESSSSAAPSSPPMPFTLPGLNPPIVSSSHSADDWLNIPVASSSAPSLSSASSSTPATPTNELDSFFSNYIHSHLFSDDGDDEEAVMETTLADEGEAILQGPVRGTKRHRDEDSFGYGDDSSTPHDSYKRVRVQT
ncbi:hypothetical protein JCM10207_003736 [Rhodosporidiobolus poonsookiae]